MKAAAIAALALVGGSVSGLLAGVFVVRSQLGATPPAAVEGSAVEQSSRRAQANPRAAAPFRDSRPTDPGSGAASAPPADPDQQRNEFPKEELSPEEEEKRWHEGYARKVARVEQEARDAEWAPRAESAFRGDLTKLAPGVSAELVKVDCRTAACLATLEWNSYKTARSSWKQVLHHDYSMGCMTIIDVGPAPPDPSRRHQVKVVFECDELRASELAANKSP